MELYSDVLYLGVLTEGGIKLDYLSFFWEAVWKSMVIFFLLLVLTRLIGRKLLNQMTFFEFVIAITIGTITGAYVVTTVKGLWVLVSPIMLTFLTVSLAFINLKSLPIRKIVDGEPTVVIQNGKILEHNMTKLRYNLDNLEMQLRDKDIFDLNQVEFAILEPHGKLSVLKKTQYLPLTPKDMKVNTSYQGMPSEIIKDGQVLEQNLKQNNLTLNWLFQELNRQNIRRIDDVFYASLNTDGTLYVDKKADQLTYEQKVED